MSDQLHDDADELLHWLNTHSVRVSDGVPASHLQAMWLKSGRETPRLKLALDWLFEQDMVGLSKGLEPRHLRFTAKGYLRLIAAMDEARVQSQNTASAEDISPTKQPAPAAVQTPQPAPSMESMQSPGRFMEPGKPPTEIGLRNQVLFIFRDLHLGAGQQLIAMTLSRYWQEMGLRGGDLRLGIDVLIRDGFLQHNMKRYENYWLLTEAGAKFTAAPVTPAALLEQAEPLKRLDSPIKTAALLRATRAVFGKDTTALPMPRLLASFDGSRDALLHGLDLFWKQGLVALHPGEPLSVALTESGISAKF